MRSIFVRYDLSMKQIELTETEILAVIVFLDLMAKSRHDAGDFKEADRLLKRKEEIQKQKDK